MPKRRVVDHVQDGEVLLVDKQAVLPEKVLELSHHKAEKLRPKAPRTAAQIENTKRLVELNKKRALEWKNRLSQSQIAHKEPVKHEEIEDHEEKVEVRVKPKNKYIRKKPVWNTAELDKPPQPPQPPRHPRQVSRPKKQTYYSSSDEESDDEEEEDIPQPLPPPVKKSRKRLVKSGKRVTSDTSESETTDTDVELHRVQKYVKKTAARMDAVNQIDQRLKQVSNKYIAAGLSVF